MDTPVVAAAPAETARGDAHPARARNAPRDANLTNAPVGSGPSPAPPTRAGVRDARGRGHERARSRWLLLTGVLVGALVSNAAHATSASGAFVLGSASASETDGGDGPFANVASVAKAAPFAPTDETDETARASRWRRLTGSFGNWNGGTVRDDRDTMTKSESTSLKGLEGVARRQKKNLALESPTRSSDGRSEGRPRDPLSGVFGYATGFRDALGSVGFSGFSGSRFPARRLRVDASSFAFGRVEADERTSLAAWRRGGDEDDEDDVFVENKNESRLVGFQKARRPRFSRTADVLGLANCPRLRVLRDLLFGEGAVAELAGVAERRKRAPRRRALQNLQNPKLQNDATKSARSDASFRNDEDVVLNEDDVYVVRALPLALFMLCPGVVLALRAHELWGLDCFEGAAATAFGFALVGMWCQGSLELYQRWYECPTRRRRATARAAARHDAAQRTLGIESRVTRSTRRWVLRRRIIALFETASAAATELAHAALDFGKTPAYGIVKSRGVVPGAARAATLEALLLAVRARRAVALAKRALKSSVSGSVSGGVSVSFAGYSVVSSVSSLFGASRFGSGLAARFDAALLFFGAACLPAFRVLYRAWYVTSRRPGSRRWLEGSRAGVARRRGAPPGAVFEDDGLEAYDETRIGSDRTPSPLFRTLRDDRSYRADAAIVDRSGSSPTTRRVDRAAYESELGARTANADVADVGIETLNETPNPTPTPEGVANANDTLERRRTSGMGFFARLNTQPLGGETAFTASPNAARADRRADVVPSAGVVPSAPASHWPAPVRLPEWLDEEKAPRHFRCPITLCVIREPAVTPAGISYERSALMQWLEHQHTEPSTKRRLKRSRVVPNLTLRGMIEDWLADERAERRRAAARAAARREARAKASALGDVKTDTTDGDGVSFASLEETLKPHADTNDAFETKRARRGEKGASRRDARVPSSDVLDDLDDTRDASVASASDGTRDSRGSSRLRRPGPPPRAGAVSQETRDRLRAARQRMYAALKRRAASGVSAEEQRWVDLASARSEASEASEASHPHVGTSASASGSFFASNGATTRRDATEEIFATETVAPPAGATNDDPSSSGGRARVAFEASEASEASSERPTTRFARQRATSRSGGPDAAVVSEDSALDTTLEEEDPYL